MNIALYQRGVRLSTHCRTLTETDRFARQVVVPGAPRVWLLRGELGSGKTAFVRAALRGLGNRRRVTSPTFTLVKIYSLRGQPWRQVAHIDLYRVRHRTELAALDLGRLVADSHTLLFIEWPERVRGLRYGRCVRLQCKHASPGRRYVFEVKRMVAARSLAGGRA